ncbi:alpha/beta hydrolase [Corynebacterium comes]|uniref:Diacylglycerol acyltransferase/mycolyltransferase Ag85A n=1 Tax=Corynebacterium comes TaxID=2675218 RepID=A0A6B8WEY2_9CORY|nr:alpha/beta hydrolase family protein [Corynebacterium comes]QGU05248.1 Diacylglycerol acyltransferase/mycolyltransferase Ag85A precursor [Corynebacterium comes]
MRQLSRRLLTAATAVALTVPAVAQAQAIPAGSDNALRDLVVTTNSSPTSSGSSLGGALSSLSLIGSSEIPLGGPLLSSDDRYPLETDETITEAAVVDKKVERPAERVERWYVTSPSMARVVEVQIKKAADPTAPAPMIYLLDGIGGSTPSSGWINNGAAERVFGNENVTLVMPTHAGASLYSDWQQDDPALGRHMWETFLTEELPPLLEAESELNFNGHRGIGGLSMGAIGAVHIANTNPALFDATFGISGCYSPTDNVGRQMVNLVVASRGGDVDNMWGPYGSEAWDAHDTTANPEGLRDMAVYLSAANGVISDEDRATYDDDPFFNMAAGATLERGVLHCTEQLDRAMRERGMTHQTVDYKDSGVHNWANYSEQLQPAWDAIRHRLL